MTSQKNELYGLIEHYFGKDLYSKDAQINKINFTADDVDHFMEDFRKTFNVDMSCYNYYDYFHENELPFAYFLSKILTALKFKKEKLPLKVSHLEDIIKSGKWVRP